MAVPHAFVAYTIKDAKGKTSTQLLNFPDSTDITVLKTFVSSTATMINNIIKGKIVEAGIGLSVDISGATIRATPDPDSDVEEGARFSWRTAVNSLTRFRLPTFDEAKLVSGTTQVDTADSDISAFTARIISGQTVGLINVSPSDDRGEDITTLEAAVESFQSSRT
jgi:hypothetical protein